MGIERFAERQAVVLNAATRLSEIVVLPETNILVMQQSSDLNLPSN